ncbi:hypothetical protein [Ruminococcus sp.]|uniref:hypothetical protein n=1 Tax=Ruminococcus sp. TaxID=41978 RepID=UPI002E81226A|nr:hypothetical protein [Ruminococcus sp.]MEE3492448.1 hypothetical protein [Ruminococcus sp.]
MKKLNFDSLNNIKAPEQWIKNAAAIPELPPKKRAFPLYRVAAAASIVLVSVIGLLTYLSFGDHEPIKLRDNAADDVQPTDAADTVTFPDDGDVLSLDSILPTLSRVYPTDAAGDPVIDNPTHPQSAREKASVTAPTEKDGSGSKTVIPTEIAAEPTQGVPSAQASEPTDPPIPTEPPEVPIPTEGHGEIPAGGLCFTATFPASMIEEGEPIYCMYQELGYAIVAEDQQDLPVQYTVMKNGMVFAMCEPVDYDYGEASTTFEYMFYQNGKVLARGTVTV